MFVAVKVAEPPAQIVAEFTLTVGRAWTVTVPEPVLAQPVVPSVTVTVDVVVEAGEMVIDCVVAPPGLHR